MKAFAWPVKSRELVTRYFDSTRWNEFSFRDDDVVIATYAKSGTTWTQQIVGQLIFDGAPQVEVNKLSPWLDMQVLDKQAVFAGLEAQRNRRFIKTHLPLDALVYSPRVKYIFVARDGRDVVWSFYDHNASMTEESLAKFNEGPDTLGPRMTYPRGSRRDYFLDWLECEGYPLWPFWSHIRGWCGFAHLPNLLVLNYADLKAALPAQIRRIADFLGIAIEDERFPTILEHCSFDYMKANAGCVAPRGGSNFKGGAKTFINQGVIGRWRDCLTPADIARYEVEACRQLGAPLATWLAGGGSLPDGGAYPVDHG